MRNRQLPGITLILLLLAASRLIKLPHIEMHSDEIWTVWQTLGSPADIVRWTPFNWTPLHYLTVGSWRVFAGPEAAPQRMLSLYWLMLAASLLYITVRHLRDARTARLAVLAFGALGWIMHISTEVRAYMMAVAVLMLAWWVMLRFFERPGWRGGLLLAALMALMVYVYAPSVTAFVAMGLYTLVAYPRKIWRWAPVGAVALPLAIPAFMLVSGEIDTRVVQTDWGFEPPAALLDYYAHYTTHLYGDDLLWLWWVLLIVASVLVVRRWRAEDTGTHALFAWAFLAPVALYLLNPVTGLFHNHYSFGPMVAIAVWLAWGFANTGRVGEWVFSAILLLPLFYPQQAEFWEGYRLPFDHVMTYMQDRYRPGDVVLVDPNMIEEKRQLANHRWDYSTRRYFPNGLEFVTDPTGHRRVWYVRFEGKQDPATFDAVRQGRVEREFVGPTNFFFRLYEAPPNPDGVLFENGLRFHGMDFLDGDDPHVPAAPLLTVHEGEPLRVRLWWSVDETLPLDYSISVRVPDLAQVDGPPSPVALDDQSAPPPSETSQWVPGQYYADDRTIEMPYPVRPFQGGLFDLWLTVYFWQDSTPIPAPGTNPDGQLWLGRFAVDAW